MRKLFVPLLLAVALAACAPVGMNAGPRQYPSDRDHAEGGWGYSTRQGDSRYRPLSARIIPASSSRGDVTFSLSRPAYVAMFEVVPGRGVGLVYPSYAGQRQQLSAGYHNPFFGNSNFRRGYIGASSFQNERYGQPRYIYLIASERPLDIAEFINDPLALRNALGMRHFASTNPYSVLEEIDALVLRSVSAEDWTSDVYVIWPDARNRLRSSYAEQQVAVQCGGGRIILVPLRYADSICPNDRPTRVRLPEQARDDEEEKEPAIRRRPLPKGGVEKGSDDGEDQTSPVRRPREVRPSPRSEPRTDSPPEVREPRRVEPRAEPRRVEPQRESSPSRAEPRSAPSEPRPVSAPTRGDTGDPQ